MIVYRIRLQSLKTSVGCSGSLRFLDVWFIWRIWIAIQDVLRLDEFVGSSNTKLGGVWRLTNFWSCMHSIELEIVLEKNERHADLNCLTRTKVRHTMIWLRMEIGGNPWSHLWVVMIFEFPWLLIHLDNIMARTSEAFQDVSRSDDLWAFGFNDTNLRRFSVVWDSCIVPAWMVNNRVFSLRLRAQLLCTIHNLQRGHFYPRRLYLW